MTHEEGDQREREIEKLEAALRATRDEVLVNVVLDMSGSMGVVWDETIDMFNEYVNGLKVKGEPASVSLIMFDEEYLPQYFGREVAQVPLLTRETYVPRGMTALLDAMGRTIVEAAALKYRPNKVIVVTITDGQENSSREYTHSSLMKLVEEKQSEGWEFLYLSASPTAFADAEAIGMAEGRTLKFAQDESSLRAARKAMLRGTESYRSMGKSDMRELGYHTDVQDVSDDEEA